MNPDHQKLAFACASAQWTPAANGTHVLGRGFEVGRFADKRARDLAVDAVTALPDIVGRVETLEIENEALRAALAQMKASAS